MRTKNLSEDPLAIQDTQGEQKTLAQPYCGVVNCVNVGAARELTTSWVNCSPHEWQKRPRSLW
jgi:hypothetical protein